MMNLFSSQLFIFDSLTIFFLSVISLVCIPSAIFSIGYLRQETLKKKFIAWALLAAFILSMCFVVTSGNLFAFLIFWELMSLVSYFLVVFDYKHEKSIRAGAIYIVMTHIGTAFLVAAFMVMFKYAHSFDFAVVKSACAAMPIATRNALFLLLLIGFGTKAGIVPLHIWLPYAHPQAPSHISSIMSGVMIKTAVYGLIRFVICILGVNVYWWGLLVLALAVVSCLVGIIYALMERDIKRLLAYSSVENMGIILIGVGLSMFFLSASMPYLAVFALIAGLYHLINHAIFKGLLFLCAGSVYKATGTRDIEKLGGLIKAMPQTAACFLVGAVAISALPPLNGFVSEWLTLQAFFLGALKVSGGIKLFLGVSAAMLALTGGLTAACFVRAFGVTFLALPRTRHAQDVKEVPLSMKMGMQFLAVLAVVFGLAAAAVIKILAKVAGAATGIDTNGMTFSLNNFTISPQIGKSICLSTPLIGLALITLGVAGFAAYRLLGRQKARAYKTWDCGYYKLDSRNEYTATAFSKPFRIAFSFFLLPYRRTEKVRQSYYHVKSFAYETHTTKVFKKFIYDPVIAMVLRSAKSMRRIQPGSIHLYLSYIFVTLLLLVIFIHKF